MAKKFELLSGDYVNIVHDDAGAVVAGEFKTIGEVNAFALVDGLAAEPVVYITKGRAKAEKNGALAVNAGDALYWNAGNGNVDKTGTGVLVGYAKEDAATADTHVVMNFDGQAAFLKA